MISRALVLNKTCIGFEGRLYRSLRLWVLYDYRSRNCGWTKDYKSRHKVAGDSMYRLANKILLKHVGKSIAEFTVKVTGSAKVIDLEANRDIEFTLIEKVTE